MKSAAASAEANWVPNVAGLTIDHGTLEGPNSWDNPFGGEINDRGEAVGYSETDVPDPDGEDVCGFGTHLTCRPFLWRGGHMSALPTLGGNNGQASAMNNRGQLTRFAETAIPDSTCPAGVTSKTDSPVVWKDGQAHALPTVGSDPDGEANGIDEEGQAVGYSGTCTAALHGVRREKGTVFQLPDLGTGAIAFGINDRGQIVGTIGSADGTTQFAALWQNGALTNHGTLKGDFAAIASGINSRGQVVGSTQDANFSFVRAFIWQDGVMTDLHTISCRFQPPRNHGQQYQLGGSNRGNGDGAQRAAYGRDPGLSGNARRGERRQVGCRRRDHAPEAARKCWQAACAEMRTRPIRSIRAIVPLGMYLMSALP